MSYNKYFEMKEHVLQIRYNINLSSKYLLKSYIKLQTNIYNSNKYKKSNKEYKGNMVEKIMRDP